MTNIDPAFSMLNWSVLWSHVPVEGKTIDFDLTKQKSEQCLPTAEKKLNVHIWSDNKAFIYERSVL